MHLDLERLAILIILQVATAPEVRFSLRIAGYSAPVDSVILETSSIILRPVISGASYEPHRRVETSRISKVAGAATEDPFSIASRGFYRVDRQRPNAEHVHRCRSPTINS